MVERGGEIRFPFPYFGDTVTPVPDGGTGNEEE